MTETLLALVPVYGAWALFAATYLSCLAMPVPSSLMMLAGGAFAASGDLALASVVGAAFTGAVAGDQTGFVLGKRGGAGFVERLRKKASLSETVRQAENRLQRSGVITVYITRWLLSPLGPYVNFVGGAMGLQWSRFTLGSVMGEATWVVIYVALGWVFAGQITYVADVAGNLAGALAAAAVAVFLGRMLFKRARAAKRQG